MDGMTGMIWMTGMTSTCINEMESMIGIPTSTCRIALMTGKTLVTWMTGNKMIGMAGMAGMSRMAMMTITEKTGITGWTEITAKTRMSGATRMTGLTRVTGLTWKTRILLYLALTGLNWLTGGGAGVTTFIIYGGSEMTGIIGVD